MQVKNNDNKSKLNTVINILLYYLFVVNQGIMLTRVNPFTHREWSMAWNVILTFVSKSYDVTIEMNPL